MRLNAVGVVSSNLKNTVKFYETLGFRFPEYKEDETHLEAITETGSARLMIDSKKFITELLGEEPKPGNHSSFAIEYNSAQELDEVVFKLAENGFTINKKPWDAFWGQRYAIVCDPDGYMVDLYAQL